MTTKEINDGNRLIAEFIGYEYIPFNNPLKIKPGWWWSKTSNIVRGTSNPEKLIGNFYLGRSVRDLPYHKDWNFLIGAIKKWDSLNEKPLPIAIEISIKKVSSEYVELCDTLDHLVTLYDILPVFKHFVKCVKWYNHISIGK
jgi:hypothetical protein